MNRAEVQHKEKADETQNRAPVNYRILFFQQHLPSNHLWHRSLSRIYPGKGFLENISFKQCLLSNSYLNHPTLWDDTLVIHIIHCFRIRPLHYKSSWCKKHLPLKPAMQAACKQPALLAWNAVVTPLLCSCAPYQHDTVCSFWYLTLGGLVSYRGTNYSQHSFPSEEVERFISEARTLSMHIYTYTHGDFLSRKFLR